MNNVETNSKELILRGIPSSPGIVLGNTVVIKQKSIFVQSEKVAPKDIQKEIIRLKEAFDILKKDYKDAVTKAKNESKNIIALLESNLLMISDEIQFGAIKERIRKGSSPEIAVVEEFESQRQYFLNSTDSFLRDRAHELDHLKFKLISILRNQKDIINAEKGSVVIAQYITPDEMIRLKEMGVSAVVTEIGGITSHSAILARNYNISQIIGVKDICSLVEDSVQIIVDGYTGTVLINPTENAIKVYQEKKTTEQLYKKELGDLIDLPAVTQDGKEIKLKININLPEDIEIMQMVGAEGVGLVRTEYLVINKGEFPDCAEQYNWYRKICNQSYPHPVTFRVFDVGSDKIAEGLPRHETNPALGFRGIRFLLERKDIFTQQICAILRASENKNAQILLPMITNLAELLDAKTIIEECKLELKTKNINYDSNIPIGIMVETPAAAMIASALARHCNFISIGTNDLTQYTLAADRANEMVAHHFDAFHPAVLRFIKMTIDAAKNNNIPVSICGELAGHFEATDILIGMGADELSITQSIFLELKKRIREMTFADAEKKTEEVLQSDCIEDIRKMLSI